MRRILLATTCLLASASAVQASDVGQGKIDSLIDSLTIIDGAVSLSVNLAMGATGYATVGGVIEDGVFDEAKVTEAMLLAYQSARQDVLDYNYASSTDASELFMENHVASMESLAIAVDALTDATSDIAMATSVAETASEADTRPEQVALQGMLQEEQYIVTGEKVDAYNEALDAVATYAQAAGAFLAAANNDDLTASVDAYVNNNGIVIGAYTAIDFIAANDEFLIDWADQGYGSGWTGYMHDQFKSAEDVYGASMYILTHGGSSEQM